MRTTTVNLVAYGGYFHAPDSWRNTCLPCSPRTRVRRPACRWYRHDEEREHRQYIFRGRCPAVVAELPVSVSVSVSVLTTATANNGLERF